MIKVYEINKDQDESVEDAFRKTFENIKNDVHCMCHKLKEDMDSFYIEE